MSHSFLAADRGTHSKVIAIAFLLSAAVGLVGFFGRVDKTPPVSNGTAVIKAAKSMITTDNEASFIR